MSLRRSSDAFDGPAGTLATIAPQLLDFCPCRTLVRLTEVSKGLKRDFSDIVIFAVVSCVDLRDRSYELTSIAPLLKESLCVRTLVRIAHTSKSTHRGFFAHCNFEAYLQEPYHVSLGLDPIIG